jgi:Ca2+-transporting ATPase
MPIVATIALARGMHRMARRNALVNRLSSVETLGSATIIASDKTGTLTENQMTVIRLLLPNNLEVHISGEGLKTSGDFTADGKRIDTEAHGALRQILRIGLLCGNAELQLDGAGLADPVGDPMEVALLVVASKAGLDKQDLLQELPEAYEVAFDPENKMMATVHSTNGSYLFAVKGAPENVIAACTQVFDGDQGRELDEQQKEDLLARAQSLAGEGLRLLGLAMKETPEEKAEPYSGLTWLGLACFLDPPREEVKGAIKAAHRAGIRTIMVTGDQIATARAIAETLSLAEQELAAMEGRELGRPEELSAEQKERIAACTVFARVSPKQKLDLIALYQERGNIVAMTGDGVNDAPALEKADIGVAMGRRGTQVAREASDMILKDDSFSTIVAAIEEGRIIFGNIRQFVLFLLTISLSMILTVFFGSIAALPMPILPLQILYLNAVTHVFPALALGMGEGPSRIMEQPPRDPEMPILERGHWLFIGAFAVLISAAALGGMLFAMEVLGMPRSMAQTISFLVVTFGQLLHVFNVRSRDTGILDNDVTRNVYVWIAIGASVLFTLLMLYVPVLAGVMQLESPGVAAWLTGVSFSMLPLAAGQTYLAVQGRSAG